jgi:hypothetical protein
MFLSVLVAYFLIKGETFSGLPVFENRVLKRIFGPKREEITRILCNSVFCNFYILPVYLISGNEISSTKRGLCKMTPRNCSSIIIIIGKIALVEP